MTACLDALDFYAPVATHEVVTFGRGSTTSGLVARDRREVLAEVP